MEWLNYVYGFVALLLGGGGLAALYKARQDAKQGAKQGEIDEDVAISEQWRNVIETQTKSLVEPLVGQVARLQGEVSVLQGEVRALKEEKNVLIGRADAYEDYIDILVRHIREELPPPEPARPVTLKSLHR